MEAKADSEETIALLDLIQGGDEQALQKLLQHHRSSVRGFIEARFDPNLAARVDPSDIVQETLMEVVRRMDDYLKRKPMPFYLWTRKTAYQRLVDIRRRHCSARRSVQREVFLPSRSSMMLAKPMLARGKSPSQQAQARELADRIARAVARLGETDQEILLMRHAEELSFEEIAYLLEVESAAARKRFGRALIRLQQILSREGLLEDYSS